MHEDPKQPPTDDDVEPAQNPEGEPRQGATNDAPNFSGGASGEEAEAAGKRATADENVSRDEVVGQSAYQDDSADLGQRAAEAERHEKE